MKPPIIQIQPIGAFFQNDKDGFVVNPASWNKIPEKWYPIIESIKLSYLDHLKDDIHSIYLRGSLARGIAVDKVSDLDSFAIVKRKGFHWDDALWTKMLSKNLSSKYDFIGEMELMLSSIDGSNSFKNPNIPMLLKTQSICIYGLNLSPSIPKFKPNKSMMLNYRWIEEDLEHFTEKSTHSETEIKDFLKVVIRCGYELVMDKEGKYTPDLYWCFDSFSKHYPAKEEAMKKALFYYLNPSYYIESEADMILELGKWLSEKVKSGLL